MDGEDRGRNHQDSETLAPEEVSRIRACIHASQALEEARAAANRGQRKCKKMLSKRKQSSPRIQWLREDSASL